MRVYIYIYMCVCVCDPVLRTGFAKTTGTPLDRHDQPQPTHRLKKLNKQGARAPDFLAVPMKLQKSGG